MVGRTLKPGTEPESYTKLLTDRSGEAALGFLNYVRNDRNELGLKCINSKGRARRRGQDRLSSLSFLDFTQVTKNKDDRLEACARDPYYFTVRLWCVI